jgi:hypothetical protein
MKAGKPVIGNSRLRHVLRLRTRRVLLLRLLLLRLLLLKLGRALEALSRRHRRRRRPRRLRILIAALDRLRLIVRIVLRHLLLGRGDQTEIMLGVLEIAFGGNRIAADCASRASCRYFSAT